MKRLLKNVLIAGAFMVGANGLFGQTSNDWLDQIYKAKLGRAPFAEARQRAEEKNTVYREEATPAAVSPANNWFENFFKAKYGVAPPSEEARLRAEAASTAYRSEENVASTKPANTWHIDHCKAKYGQVPPAIAK